MDYSLLIGYGVSFYFIFVGVILCLIFKNDKTR